MECNELFLQALEETYDDEFENYMISLEERYGCEHIFGNKHNREMAKLIKRQRRPYFKLISTAGRRAACIIVAFIVMSASALSVKAIREAFFDFISNIFSDHSVVTTESGTDKGYPTNIEEEYYISELPDGFEEMDKGKTDNSIDISYFRNDEYILTYKSRLGVEAVEGTCVCHETEVPLTKESYEHLKQKIDDICIQKRRYMIPYQEHTIELDVFDGAHKGLVLAEVEFSSVEESNDFVKPEWFGDNVSDDERYSNRYMSKNGVLSE